MDYRKAFDLSGMTAVITGGASGIGLEAARALGQCGAALDLLDLCGAALEAAGEKLSGEGLRVHTSVRIPMPSMRLQNGYFPVRALRTSC